MNLSLLSSMAAIWAVLASACPAAEPATAPVVPGLGQKHPLNERQIGELLIDELRCASCHDGINGAGMKVAPDLKQVGARVKSGYLQRFIADPASVHPGTTMPGMFAAESEENRRQISESISHYLQSLQEPEPRPEKAGEGDGKVGRELFHGIGCVACHSPRDEAGKKISTPGDLSLSHVPGKYRADALAEFLSNPLKVRPSGRMPDMGLSKLEAASLARYLAGKPSTAAAEMNRPDPGQVAAGKVAFKKYDCAACHQLDDSGLTAVRSGPPLGKLNPMRGCLTDKPGPAPDYYLNEAQVKSIRAALEGPAAPPSAADRIKMKLTRLNCISCHVRDDYGGVAADRDAFFRSTEEAMGNEARIPPPLTLTGGKLRPEWLRRVLYDGETVRPYMHTRMPQYGEAALKGLPEWLAEVDHLDPGDFQDPPKIDPQTMSDTERAWAIKMKNAGRQLLGDAGLGCIACHNFNGTESPGMKGIDRMTSYQRLQPACYHRYMQNPAAFRPGIIMPSYWPEAKRCRPGSSKAIRGNSFRRFGIPSHWGARRGILRVCAHQKPS